MLGTQQVRWMGEWPVGRMKIIAAYLVTLSYSITTKPLPLSCHGLQKAASEKQSMDNVPNGDQESILIGTRRNF